MLRKEKSVDRHVLVRREPNAFGVRCGESQADGVPCPGPQCDCDDCRRAYEVMPSSPQRGTTTHA